MVTRLLLLGLCAFAGFGQTPATIPAAKAALIDDMFQLTKAESLITQMMQQYKSIFTQSMEKSFSDQLAKIGDKTDYTPEIKAYEDKVFALLMDRMDWRELKPKMAKLYDETFTEQELSDMVAFYKTPSGQSALTKLPALNAKAMRIGQEQVGDVGPDIQKLSSEFLQEVKKKRESVQK